MVGFSPWRAPLALALLVAPSAALGATCGSLVPSSSGHSAASRLVTASDLIELRDIGNEGAADPTSPIAVAPDGRSIAFQIRRADIATNSYCFGLYVLALDGHAPPREIDRGGEPIMWPGIWFDAITPKLSGYLQVNQPQWSPGGEAIAYLRKDKGVTQLWLASADGQGARPLTRSLIDVIDFQWAADGRSILYRDRPHYRAIGAQIEHEGLRGFHYDDRWQPDDDATRPLIFDRAPPALHRIAIATGDDLPLADQAGAAWRDLDDEHRVRRADGVIAAIVPSDPSNLTSDTIVEIKRAGAARDRCRARQCRGHLAGIWWEPGSGDLLILRREGWGHETNALYRWRPGDGEAALVMRTEALVTGCRVATTGLACMAENALRPRYIVVIDTHSGIMSTLFDPNPDFGALQLGSVRRLYWKNALGLQAFGDLVLPPGHRPGQRHPLVVTQYVSRGFLRGGTGDAYPIQLMAAAGYAVLSTQDPGSVADHKPARTDVELNRHNVVGAADARSGLSSLEGGVAKAVATGLVDPDRMAITGLSDGAFKARYAILHSRLFKTALISSCCDDPTSDALLGTLNMANRHAFGWPAIGDFKDPLWSSFSLLARARNFDIPLLIQASSHEYLQSVVTVMAMQQNRKPVDLYVYPDEYHVLWQPAHRAAYYQRDLDWLDFWLRGGVPSDIGPARAAEFRRWAQLRADWQASRSARDRSGPGTMIPHRKAGGAGSSRLTRVPGRV